MEASEHNYGDIIKKIKLLEDGMYTYTIDGRKVTKEEFEKEFEKKFIKTLNNYCIHLFPKERFINQIEFKKECKKWTGKLEEN